MCTECVCHVSALQMNGGILLSSTAVGKDGQKGTLGSIAGLEDQWYYAVSCVYTSSIPYNIKCVLFYLARAAEKDDLIQSSCILAEIVLTKIKHLWSTQDVLLK